MLYVCASRHAKTRSGIYVKIKRNFKINIHTLYTTGKIKRQEIQRHSFLTSFTQENLQISEKKNVKIQ